MSWLNSWSEGINKRMCRFLLHRYLGQLLRDKLCLEQLTVDVFNGTGKIDELMLDVEWINGQLSQLRSASPNMPRFKLVDGYIGSLAVHIPWQNLLATSCTLTVDRLEVTIAVDAHADQIVDEIQAASLVDSLVGSMASSVQLAKSILSETDSLGDQVDGAADRDSAAEGVEAFAQIIEAVLARLHVTVNDIIVRLESAEESTAESLLATAVEIRVDKCSFVDEQMDKLSSVGQGNCENLGTQPTHTLHSVEGLSKLLYLHGVRLYTDSFTRPSYSEVLEDNGAICTSMYIRRKKEKSNVDDPQMLENHQSIFSSSQFVSCYSHISNNAKNSEIVMSQPILVASLGSEKQTVRFRLKNEKLYASQGQNVQIDIQLFLGTLYSIASPSQINIVTRLISEFLPDFNATSGGKKYHDMSVAKEKVMDLKDFSKIEEMLLQAASTDDNLHQRGTGKLRLGDGFFSIGRLPNMFLEGNWSGAQSDTDKFFSLEDRRKIRDRHYAFDNESVSGGGTSQIQIRAKLACVLVKALCREPEHRDVMQQLSDQFHQAVNKLEWTNLSKTNDRNSSLSDACQLPHLSLYLSPLALEILSEELCDPNAAKLNKNSLFCAKISSARAAMSEFHYSSGSECSNELAESQLLVFDDADSEQGMDACLQCELSRNANIAKTITNSEAYSIRVDLAPCKIEIDMSIVDRISQLLEAPFLKQSKMASFDTNPYTMTGRSAPVSNSLALSDDIFTCDKTTSDGQSAEFDLSVKCAKMTVDLRIPAADLTPISSGQDVEARRCVHREILRFQFDAAKVHMAAGQGQQLNTNGCVAVHANRIIGWLRSATSDGAYDSLPVLQAANECRVWDWHPVSVGFLAEFPRYSWGELAPSPRQCFFYLWLMCAQKPRWAIPRRAAICSHRLF